MNRIFICFLLTLVLATPALAQDENMPTYVVSVHECNWAQLDSLTRHNRERTLPILKTLVEEGKLIEAGEAVHQWGDEYNLLTWLAAPDIPSVLSAFDEMNARYDKAYPDDNFFIETCPQHRDYFYTQRAFARSGSPPAEGADAPTLAVSYFTCDYPELNALIEDGRTRQLPVAQALIDEGLMRSQGFYTHAWGDEWNFLITRTAADLPALLTALESYEKRYETQYGENTRSLLEEHCSAHKDNIYTITMQAN